MQAEGIVDQEGAAPSPPAPEPEHETVALPLADPGPQVAIQEVPVVTEDAPSPGNTQPPAAVVFQSLDVRLGEAHERKLEVLCPHC